MFHVLRLFELREKSDITVAATSKYFANVMYGYRNHGLSVVCFIFIFFYIVFRVPWLLDTTREDLLSSTLTTTGNVSTNVSAPSVLVL